MAAIDGTRVVWMAIGHDEPYTSSLYYKNLASGKSSKIGTQICLYLLIFRVQILYGMRLIHLTIIPYT